MIPELDLLDHASNGLVVANESLASLPARGIQETVLLSVPSHRDGVVLEDQVDGFPCLLPICPLNPQLIASPCLAVLAMIEDRFQSMVVRFMLIPLNPVKHFVVGDHLLKSPALTAAFELE